MITAAAIAALKKKKNRQVVLKAFSWYLLNRLNFDLSMAGFILRVLLL